MPGLDHAAHAVPPVNVGGSDEFVHAGQVDLHAVDRLGCRREARGEPGDLAQVATPRLDADRLTAAPVDHRGRGAGDAQQTGHHGDDVVLVDRVVRAGRVDMDGDVGTVDHHLEMDGRPAAAVAVGNGQTGDG